ncbi:MAG: hypothetical protein JWM16_3292 [Verrucomicrobiales bacterium]|nr:hypothetical protein [Verrucomicrobiales bacterium]
MDPSGTSTFRWRITWLVNRSSPAPLPGAAGASGTKQTRLNAIKTGQRNIPSVYSLHPTISIPIYRCKGSGPKRFSPVVPGRQPNSTSTQTNPMQGTRLIRTHHPDLSRSCQRLICTMMATTMSGSISSPRTPLIAAEPEFLLMNPTIAAAI